MPYHSIIIPHRNRNRALAQTLWSIWNSASICRIRDYEVVVVDALSDQPVHHGGHVRVVTNHIRSKLFNKSLCLNLGIEQSDGAVLTFLDADMLVGPQWMYAPLFYLIAPKPPTKLCYRARQLKVTDHAEQNQDAVLTMLETSKDRPALLRGWFNDYESRIKCFEAYGDPDEGHHPKRDEPVFGNSQFSIRRDILGDLRYNDEMAGAGFEDLWMNRQIWDRYGERYRGAIPVDPEMNLLHMQHPRPQRPDSDWCTAESNTANRRLYKKRWPHTSWLP